MGGERAGFEKITDEEAGAQLSRGKRVRSFGSGKIVQLHGRLGSPEMVLAPLIERTTADAVNAAETSGIAREKNAVARESRESARIKKAR